MAGVIISPGQYYLGGNTFAGGTAEAFQRGAKSTQDMLAQQQTMEMGQFAEQRARTGEQRTQQKFPLDLEKLRADTEQARALSEQARATAISSLGSNRRADEKLAPEIEQLRAQAAQLRANAAVALSAEERAVLERQADLAERIVAQETDRAQNPNAWAGIPRVDYYQFLRNQNIVTPGSGRTAPAQRVTPGQRSGNAVSMPPGLSLGSTFQAGGTVVNGGAIRPDGSFDPAPGEAGPPVPLPPPYVLPTMAPAEQYAVPRINPGLLPSAVASPTDYTPRGYQGMSGELGMGTDLPPAQPNISRTTAESFTPSMVAQLRNWNNLSGPQKTAVYEAALNELRAQQRNRRLGDVNEWLADRRPPPSAYLPETYATTFAGRNLPEWMSGDAAAARRKAEGAFLRSMDELSGPPGVRTYPQPIQPPGLPPGVQAYSVYPDGQRVFDPNAPENLLAEARKEGALKPSGNPGYEKLKVSAEDAKALGLAPTAVTPAAAPAIAGPSEQDKISARQNALVTMQQTRAAVDTLNMQYKELNDAYVRASNRRDANTVNAVRQQMVALRSQLVDQHGVYAAAALRTGDATPAVQFLQETIPGAVVVATADGGVFVSAKDANGNPVRQSFAAEELASRLNAVHNPQVREQVTQQRAQQMKFAELAFKSALEIQQNTSKIQGQLRADAFIKQLEAQLKPGELKVTMDPQTPGSFVVTDSKNNRVGYVRMKTQKIGDTEVLVSDPTWVSM